MWGMRRYYCSATDQHRCRWLQRDLRSRSSTFTGHSQRTSADVLERTGEDLQRQQQQEVPLRRVQRDVQPLVASEWKVGKLSEWSARRYVTVEEDLWQTQYGLDLLDLLFCLLELLVFLDTFIGGWNDDRQQVRELCAIVIVDRLTRKNLQQTWVDYLHRRVFIFVHGSLSSKQIDLNWIEIESICFYEDGNVGCQHVMVFFFWSAFWWFCSTKSSSMNGPDHSGQTFKRSPKSKTVIRHFDLQRCIF